MAVTPTKSFGPSTVPSCYLSWQVACDKREVDLADREVNLANEAR
jgi:hypothetical protein